MNNTVKNAISTVIAIIISFAIIFAVHLFTNRCNKKIIEDVLYELDTIKSNDFLIIDTVANKRIAIFDTFDTKINDTIKNVQH